MSASLGESAVLIYARVSQYAHASGPDAVSIIALRQKPRASSPLGTRDAGACSRLQSCAGMPTRGAIVHRRDASALRLLAAGRQGESASDGRALHWRRPYGDAGARAGRAGPPEPQGPSSRRWTREACLRRQGAPRGRGRGQRATARRRCSPAQRCPRPQGKRGTPR